MFNIRITNLDTGEVVSDLQTPVFAAGVHLAGSKNRMLVGIHGDETTGLKTTIATVKAAKKLVCLIAPDSHFRSLCVAELCRAVIEGGANE